MAERDTSVGEGLQVGGVGEEFIGLFVLSLADGEGALIHVVPWASCDTPVCPILTLIVDTRGGLIITRRTPIPTVWPFCVG